MEKDDYIIVRCQWTGVYAGYFESRDGREVTLTNARRIWYWNGAASLSELAMKGTSRPRDCKFPAPVNSVLVLDAIEILPCTPEAKESIQGVPVWSNH